MLLRRIIDHVREQNWTAVALDFVIVVMGVLMAFQITTWNETRAANARAIAYLERLDADLAADMENFRLRVAFWKLVSDYGLTAIDFADHDDKGDNSNWELLVAFFQASQIDNFNITRPTYDEMTNAGEIGLIANVTLREELSLYYTNAAYVVLSETPAYRTHVRGVIPIEIQAYIWDSCYQSNAYNGQFLLSCEPPVSDERAGEIIDAIAADESIMAELRYWLSTLHVARFISDNRIELAESIRHSIAVELGKANGAPAS